MSTKKASAGSARRPTVKSNAQTPRIKLNPHAFMEFEVDEGNEEKRILGKVIFELFEEKLPKTVQNFKSLCLGDKGKTKPVKELNNAIVNLHYKGTNIHRIVKGFVIQGGDVVTNNGQSGHATTSRTFDDESFEYKHEPFCLTSPNFGTPNTNTSQFAITLCKAPWLDDNYVVFGRVRYGFDVLKQIESFGTDNGKVIRPISIKNCGVFTEEEVMSMDSSSTTNPSPQLQ
ncbi:hypothetical protein C9374_013943 [Naegleria lovaniensis]|uniref:Peptidyl-prolyl cis-trans isomerase n=1 Tax=Naegleria lovaniensis TaxID=51637 RepID=A0AA88H1P2_NAELO|nr:uncharacterized protein C9374_013943 [Naegleria lovaniensis]KAG2389383.1 hypothetical protein C9374_013943 [Naegleria lovaniensis]